MADHEHPYAPSERTGPTTALTFRPPNSALFAAAQVEAAEGADAPWEIIGANPAYTLVGASPPAMVPADRVSVDCYLRPEHQRMRVLWVYEDSQLGLETVVTEPQRSKAKPGRKTGW